MKSMTPARTTLPFQRPTPTQSSRQPWAPPPSRRSPQQKLRKKHTACYISPEAPFPIHRHTPSTARHGTARHDTRCSNLRCTDNVYIELMTPVSGHHTPRKRHFTTRSPYCGSRPSSSLPFIFYTGFIGMTIEQPHVSFHASDM